MPVGEEALWASGLAAFQAVLVATDWHPPVFRSSQSTQVGTPTCLQSTAAIPLPPLVATGLAGPTLVIEVGPHTHFSNVLPAGRTLCGVAWAPGAHATDGTVFAFGRWRSHGLLERWPSDAWPSLSRNPCLTIDVGSTSP